LIIWASSYGGKSKAEILTRMHSILVPKIEVGRCLGPRGSGDGSGGGYEGGPGPPDEKGDKQSAHCKGDKQPSLTNGDKQPAPNKGDGQLTPNKERDNMKKEEEEKKSQA
jgi:hypothetical protein